MNYKLPRSVFTQEISMIISREMRKQNLIVSRASKDNLKEIAEVSQIIRKSGIPKYLVCRKLPNNLGRGIFLHPGAEPILRGQIIAPYAGKVSLTRHDDPSTGAYSFAPLEKIYLTKEEQARFDKEHKFHPRRHYSLVIDAVKTGNFTRFINHSEKPNVSACMLSIPSNKYGLEPSFLEVVYIAKRTIHPGQQLLVCYEDEEESYWGVFKIKPFPMTPKTFRLSSSLRVIKECS